MNERPILFSAPMVRAILDGRKTTTRRIIKHKKQLYIPGCLLWVRETWSMNPEKGAAPLSVVYRADPEWDEYYDDIKWHPSIFMPRVYSRITLRIVKVRDDWLNNISESDAKAEGVNDKAEFSLLWDKINGNGAFAKNPMVWVIEFERIYD